MQLNRKGGSMGIPGEMHEALDKHREQAKAEEKKKSPPSPDEDGKPPEIEEEGSKEESLAKKVGAAEILKKLGIEFDKNDINQLIMKGSVTKDIEIVKGVLTATMRTLTTEEYDVVDEIAVTDLKELNISNTGFETRKSVLILCFGVTHLMGRPIVAKKPLTEDKQVDLYALAELQRGVFKKMSGQVVDKLIEAHGAFSIAINMILRNPEDILKNS